MSDNGLSSKWDYNAPQYIDFLKISAGVDEPDVEDYFNFDHEVNLLNSNVSSEFWKQEVPTSNDNQSDKENLDGEEDTIASPIVRMGRMRVVLAVNEQRKRLSMSVDRGRKQSRNVRTSISPRNKSVEKAHISPKELKVEESQKVQLMQNESDIVAAITKGVSEEVRLEGTQNLKTVPHKGIPMKPSFASRLTHIQPFSFDKRHCQGLAKKEEFVKKILAEEKKAREFKAQPFPQIIFTNKTTVTSQNLRKKNGSNPQLNTKPAPKEKQQTFRAKPASVLHKEPFKPIKTQTNTTESTAFNLSTERRAQMRAEWDNFVRGKEEQKEHERREMEKKRQAEEEANIKELRAKLVHKPTPMPNLKPVEGKPPAASKRTKPAMQKRC